MSTTTSPTFAPDLCTPMGYDTDLGFRIAPGTKIEGWATKREALSGARAIGWDTKTIERVWTTFTWFYALHAAAGGFLTPTGYQECLDHHKARHETRTIERGEGTQLRKINSRGTWRAIPAFTYWWSCTCGAKGAGHDRSDVRSLAHAHRVAFGEESA